MDVVHSCRCCLRRAPDKDLMTPYTHLGRTEIYSDMLKKCFEIHLLFDSEEEVGICDVCVGRLRDASDFKLQVQHSLVELQAWLQEPLQIKEENSAVKLIKEDGDGTSEEPVLCEEAPIKLKIKNEDEISDEERQEMLEENSAVKLIKEDGAGTSEEPVLCEEASIKLEIKNEDEISDEERQEMLEQPCCTTSDGKITTSSKMWNCGSCNQLFSTARDLYRHKRGEDRPSGAPLMAYVCAECNKVLSSKCALHTHKNMHKGSKPGYPCLVCGRRFNQSGHLAIHMRMHTGERPYPCDLCPKAFKLKVERDDHRRTHTGERPFACAACPKTFTAAARLREHARIHTDQRPYRCDICGAAFRRPYARTVHTLIHTGEKPHECDVCGTTFRRSGDMWKHKRTLHGVQAGSGGDEPKS